MMPLINLPSCECHDCTQARASTHSGDKIHAAVMAERERCVKIVEHAMNTGKWIGDAIEQIKRGNQ